VGEGGSDYAGGIGQVRGVPPWGLSCVSLLFAVFGEIGCGQIPASKGVTGKFFYLKEIWSGYTGWCDWALSFLVGSSILASWVELIGSLSTVFLMGVSGFICWVCGGWLGIFWSRGA
jgi:hypothetical protein